MEHSNGGLKQTLFSILQVVHVLYLISYKFYGFHEKEYVPFFNALDDMGENIMLYDGAFLLNSVLTAYGVRKQLLPHIMPADKFVVCQMYREHSAGKLEQNHKDFIFRTIDFDPTPYSPHLGYYSF